MYLVRKPSKRVLMAGLALVMMVPAAINAYYRVFVGIKPYDDEGTLMDMTRNFLSGHPLYDVVPCIYGPAFFLYQWVAYRLAGLPMATDSIRFVTMTFWLLANVLLFGMVYRGTRSWLMAAGTAMLAFLVLRYLGEDPGHPQELCQVLVLGLGIAACCVEGARVVFSSRRNSRENAGDVAGAASWRAAGAGGGTSSCAAGLKQAMWWLGVLAGALAMTKINAGALTVVAIGLVLTHALKWRWARTAAIIGTLGFVWVLMAPLFSMDWARRYFLLEELALAGVMISLWHADFEVHVGPREFATAGAGFVASVVALGSFALATGSTAHAMFEWMILKPRAAIGPAWYWELKISNWMLAWIVIGLLAALAAQTRWARPWTIAATKLLWGAGIAWLIVSQRIPFIMTVAPPLLWLVTITEDSDARERLSTFSRALLASIGALLVLYAYPVAGQAQIKFVCVFLMGVTAIATYDGLRWLTANAGKSRHAARWVAYAGTALVMVRFCVLSPLHARQEYLLTPALGVAGARRLHLSEDAMGLRNLVKMMPRRCSMLLTVPGMPSFNIWTGLPRPTALGGGNWVTGLDDSVQEETVREISGNSRLCVVYNADVVKQWTHNADVSMRPLIRFIDENFRPVAWSEKNVLLVRREQP